MPEYLTRKIGPLPTWAWLLAIGGGLAFRYLRKPTVFEEPLPDEGVDYLPTSLPSGGIVGEGAFAPSPYYYDDPREPVVIDINVKPVPSNKPNMNKQKPKPRPKPKPKRGKNKKRDPKPGRGKKQPPRRHRRMSANGVI